MIQSCLTKMAILTAVGMLFAATCRAETARSLIKNAPVAATSGVNFGGLSLAPERFRYRPQRIRTPGAAANVDLAPINHRLDSMSDDIVVAYNGDRQSLLNSIRARRGLALLTFWETADRCLFFGLNAKGQPGVNLVRTRQLRRVAAVDPHGMHALYAELMAQPRPNFPQPPSILD